MKLFGRDVHGADKPWEWAPPWAIELRCILGPFLEQQDRIMTAIDDLNTAVADLKAAGTRDMPVA
jgi:hypothetical protein